MSIGVSVTVDTGRALMAAMQPITGRRANGAIRLRTKPGVVLTLPRNSYWMPVVDGQRETAWLYKAIDGPNSDKSWTVDDSGTSTISVVSNIGGKRHNVDVDTQFQPDIPIDGLLLVGVDAPKAVADFTGGEDPVDYCGVRAMALYETFDGPSYPLDIHRSPLGQFPAVMVAFQNLEPADGVAIAQNNQAAVNAGDGKKFFKISYSISVITSRDTGDAARRQEGLMIADTIAALLNDKHAADPGECLSNPGGVQVRQMIREGGTQDIYQKFYIYTLLVSAMVLIKRIDNRVYNPWLRAVLSVDKPQVPVLPNQGDYRVVDEIEIDMTPGVVDLPLDGTFARATLATLWELDGVRVGSGEMYDFASGERRFTNPALGIMLEPAITNALGSAAQNLGDAGWVPSGGAVVTVNVEDDPQGATLADQLAFDADADSQLDYAALTGTVSEPVTLQVFVKAPGNKFVTAFRLAAVDAGAVEHVSDDIEVGSSWELHRFEVIPTVTGALTFRLKNASDAQARNVIVWGAHYSDGARWGSEYPGVGTKVKDTLTFTPLPVAGQQANLVTPQAVLSGRWRLRFRTPDRVPSDVHGTGAGATSRVLVSVGDGATELVTITLIGTPSTGGARLTLSTRGAGLEVDIAGLEWAPGVELAFTVDALEGTLTVAGSLNGDGEYAFARYAEDALPGDFLVIGDTSDGASSPAPGRYVAVEVNV